jgi:hypothetical protein
MERLKIIQDDNAPLSRNRKIECLSRPEWTFFNRFRLQAECRDLVAASRQCYQTIGSTQNRWARLDFTQETIGLGGARGKPNFARTRAAIARLLERSEFVVRFR